VRPDDFALMASGLAGLGTSLLAFACAAWALEPPGDAGFWSEFERTRREILRSASLSFRTFEGLIGRLEARLRLRDPSGMETLGRLLETSGKGQPWRPGEFLAVRQVEGLAAGLGLGFLIGLLAGSPILGGILVLPVAWLVSRLAVGEVSALSKKRIDAIRRRLPYAVDLLALMMEAGSSFQEAIGVVHQESLGTPLGDEIGRILSEIEMGRTRSDALDSFQRRLLDGDVTEFVFAVNTGEELGTPLGLILKHQASQLRLKRSQWIERAAAEAQVKIVLPGMLTMVACLLVVATPFLLQGLYTFL
jgi:tight adherence protein C